tara:strand:- start:279 stop:578 length:300 start_codon:yes stop_codon:yes gene_type:complete
MKVEKDGYNNKTYQFNQKVNEDNQVYILLERGLEDNKFYITIHNGDYDEQHIEIEGVDFQDDSDTDVEFRIDINGCDSNNICDETKSERIDDKMLTLIV